MSRRTSKGNSRLNALARLKAARDGKNAEGEPVKRKRQIDEITPDENGDMFEHLTEEQYAALVKQRREDRDFVVDDGFDFGYADNGEEWFDPSLKRNNKKQKMSNKSKKRDRKKEDEIKAGKVSNLFLGGGRQVVGPTSEADVMAQMQDDGDLEDMLESLIENPVEGMAPPRSEGRQKPAQSLLDMALFGVQGDLNEAYDHITDYKAEEYDDDADLQPRLKGHEAVRQRRQHQAQFSQNLSAGGIELDFELEDDLDDYGTSMMDDSGAMDVSMDVQPDALQAKEQQQQQGKVRHLGIYDEDDELEAEQASNAGADWFTLSNDLNQEYNASKLKEMETSGAVTHAQRFNALNLDESGNIKVFWFDAYSPPTQPHLVYLFGRILIPDVDDKGNKKGSSSDIGKKAGSMRTESCCVIIENMERNMFILPRKYKLRDATDETSVTSEEVQFQDVYSEIRTIMEYHNVTQFGVKPVTRKYCFQRETVFDHLNPNREDGQEVTREEAEEHFASLEDPELGVPKEGKYLKLMYSAEEATIPSKLKGTTFSHVFGTKTSPLELFLLKRDLMGPQWLDLTGVQPVSNPTTHCKYEFTLKSHKNLSKNQDRMEAPFFKVASIAIKTLMDDRRREQICMVSVLVHNAVSVEGPTLNEKEVTSFTICTTPDRISWPFDLRQKIAESKLTFMMANNERALLSLLLGRLHAIDPDVLVGHGIHFNTLDVLFARMKAVQVKNWSRISRIKRNRMPENSRGGFSLVDLGACCGRLVCDTKGSAQEFVRETNYTLGNLAKTQLKVFDHKELDRNAIPAFFKSSDELLYLSKHTLNDAYLSLGLMHKLVVLPLTLQLTNLAGNLWIRSLRQARAERVEYLLLHEFHRNKYIIPEKYNTKQRQARDERLQHIRGMKVDEAAKKKPRGRRQKAAYAGGLVLEPKKGFYEKFVLLLDFNSLYPSIIREFNICFTTIKHHECVTSGSAAPLPEFGEQNGVLPRVVKRLLERRGLVKKMLKVEQNAVKAKQLDIRQKALKLVANSMYGCLGFRNSRFFCEPLAALVTQQGRDTLQGTVSLANDMGHPVIYGDTDSIMVYTNSLNINDIMVIANNIKRAVNKKYRILEIEIDGVYKNMLLLKKKKYAALSLVNNTDGKKIFKKEVKGLDLVRRDWCVLSKVVGNFVLAQILSGEKQRDEMIETIHSHLRQLREDMMSDKIPLKKYVITKGLSKAPNEYPDANGQPHVQAALQMISMGKTVRVGDFIPYVVCEGEGPMAKRAYAPDMVTKSEGKLRVDRKWYLETQLLPPLARLTDPIEETDAARLADCLGLDAKNFHKYDKDDGEDDLVLATHQDDVERYKAADKLIVRCHKCEQDYAYTGVYRVPPFDLSAQSPDVIKRTFLPVVSGFACTNPKCGPILDQDDVRHTVANFTNTLTMQIRRHMSRYYEGWAVCNDNSCKYRSSQISTKDNQCPNVACNGVMVPEYNAADLYLQLSYFSYLFDMQRAEENVKSENKTREAAMIEYAQPQLRFELPRLDRIAMQNVFRFVQSWLQKSAYHYVDFSSIFGTRAPSKNPFAVGRANPMQLAH